jgi:hypothetical protein
MKRVMVLASAVMLGVALLSGGAGAQGTPQIIELAKVDVHTLAAGYRASKIIGSSVVNDANETIGKIDDLLVSSDGKQPYASPVSPPTASSILPSTFLAASRGRPCHRLGASCAPGISAGMPRGEARATRRPAPRHEPTFDR